MVACWLTRCALLVQECAQELARCLADGGEKPGTDANQRIHEIISARVSVLPCPLVCCPRLRQGQTSNVLCEDVHGMHVIHSAWLGCSASCST